MGDTLVQIVDNHDQPVGSATIDETQFQGLIARFVRVMVESPSGKVLLQMRTTTSKVYPACWDNSAAGHVDEGEAYEFAANRELAEEVGIKDVKLEKIGEYYTDTKYRNRTLKRFNKIYKTIVDPNTKLTLQPDEVSDAKWFTVDEVKALIKDHPDQVTDGVIDAFERYY